MTRGEERAGGEGGEEVEMMPLRPVVLGLRDA
jgi:hypothetical protein